MDPFSGDRHVTVALYCVGTAVLVVLGILAALASDYCEALKTDPRRRNKRQ